jgi:23S rRNA (uridine2552-2'-O)-methyltransferase
VLKLEEIDRRYRLFRPGQRVLDLGAAPGSWTLFASQRVGKGGHVFAIDLSPIEIALPANVVAVVADAFASDETVLLRWAPYDVVLSDMAPRTSGSKTLDQTGSQELCQRALQVADAVSAPGACFVTKLFMSQALADLKRAVADRYAECRVVRPAATRSQSSEVFVVGLRRGA